MTNLDIYGNYPIPDDFELQSDVIPFETMWKNTIQFTPVVCYNWDKAPEFKILAGSVYKEMMDTTSLDSLMKLIQDVVNQAYEDGETDGRSKGYDEGYDDGIDTCITELKELKSSNG